MKPALGPACNWIGRISDSMCGANHRRTGPGGDTFLSAREGTLACVNEGAQFVLVTDGRVHRIENQNHPALQSFAGRTVIVSGAITGDAIAISNIALATE